MAGVNATLGAIGAHKALGGQRMGEEPPPTLGGDPGRPMDRAPPQPTTVSRAMPMAKAWYQIRLTLLGRKATGTGCTGSGNRSGAPNVALRKDSGEDLAAAGYVGEPGAAVAEDQAVPGHRPGEIPLKGGDRHAAFRRGRGDLFG